MVAVRNGLAVSVAALVVLLAVLGTSTGLGALPWGVGLACGLVMSWAVARGLSRSGADALGPADVVTLARATVACGVAALVADSFLGPPAVPALVSLAVGALVLDAVDGRVARSTRTSSVFGARFDGEADAFLILVLSVYVAHTVGSWVLVIGLARYAFAAAGWVLPWLQGDLPVRYWAKVVAASQGVVLTFAATDVAPHAVTYGALVLALALLVESFGWSVLWLWRHRSTEPVEVAVLAGRSRLQLP